MSNRGWIGVDLDGTLAKYDGWKGIEHIGDPIPLMVDRVQKWIATGEHVKIFTARVCPAGDGRDMGLVVEKIQDWCEKHIGIPLEVTCQKDFSMKQLWDDRCVQVIANTGVRADGGI